ncbi:MAG: sugar nucleotidyltransferase [Pseudonocardiaceae bacterium]
MKGIIVADGADARLHPITLAVPRQLLPVGGKPLIYYPLSVLVLAGIRNILVMAAAADLPQIRRLLGDGSQLGLAIDYAGQDRAGGPVEAFIIGADHIGDENVAVIVDDNIFHGHQLSDLLEHHAHDVPGCVLFRWSNRAITGLYFYHSDVVDLAKELVLSEQGKRDIAGLNRAYSDRGRTRLVDLGRGFAWFDAATPESLMRASQYIHALEERQGVRIACLEEVALRMGFITAEACHRLGARLAKSEYGQYVMAVAQEPSPQKETAALLMAGIRR